MIGRRWFAALLGATPIAGVALGRGAMDANPPPSIFPAGAVGTGSKAAQQVIYPKNWNAYRQAIEAARYSDLWRIKEGFHNTTWIDPSIAVLKSVTQINKYHMQAAMEKRRSDAERASRASLAKLFGVEDFIEKLNKPMGVADSVSSQG